VYTVRIMIRIKDTLKQDSEKPEWNYVFISEESIPADIMATKKRALKIRYNIKTSTWTSSMFYNDAQKGYILGIKKEMRDQQKIKVGDLISLAFEIL
jgi:Domain of unknown function (DUF1905)